MKMVKSNIWGYSIAFVAGSLICYMALQFKLLEIKKEVDLPNLLASIGTACVGLYIAHTIQKRINKNQNQYSYIEAKIDSVWTQFNSFSFSLTYSNKVEVREISKISKKYIHPIEFIEKIFASFELDVQNLKKLETDLESLENVLSAITPTNNIIDYTQDKQAIESALLIIHQDFSAILKQIQNL